MLRTALPSALVLLTAGLASAQTFDPAADFRPTVNAGTWTYGSQAPGGAFALDTDTWTSASGAVRAWQGADYQAGDGFRYPFVMRNTGTTPAGITTNYGQGVGFTLAPGELAMGGSSYLHAVLRFTAPAAGRYTVDGAFTKIVNTGVTGAGAGTNVTIGRGANSLFASEITGAQGTAASFSLGTITLAAGDTLDFSVFDGPNTAFNATRLNARVVAAPVPEPATLAALGLGLAALARRRRAARA